jgi:hypothetical protein
MIVSLQRTRLMLLLSATLVVLPLHAHAQACGANASSTIATDRPQITNSSIVVPCGSVQLENGLQETGDGGQRGYDLPETSVRFGVTNKTELRLAVPDYFFNEDTGSAFAGGFGDLVIGLKQQLGPAHGFDVSLIPSLSLPTGAHAISSHGYDAALQLPWSRSLSKNWTAAGQLAVMWPTQSGRHVATGQASVYFDRQLTAPWDAYIEYSGDYPQRGGPVHGIDFGTAYKLSPHQQLDVHCGFGLSAAAPGHTIGVGYSFRFQAIGGGKTAKK